MILLRLTHSEDFSRGKKYKVMSQVAGFEEMCWVKNNHGHNDLVDCTNTDDWRICKAVKKKSTQSINNKRK